MKVLSTEEKQSQLTLTIEVSQEEAKPHLEAAAKRISQEVEVKGFRAGKAPYDVIAQKVGEQVIYEEAFQKIVESTYPEAIDQQDVMVVGRASIDVEKLAPGNEIVYKVTVPLMPKVQLGDYKKLKSKKEEAVVEEDKFDAAMKDLQQMRAKENAVEREAKEGDKVVMDFDVKVDGVSIEGGQGLQQGIVIGESKFIPGFEEAVVGMKKGEEKTFDVTFPKDYFKEDLAGKPASVDVKVHEVFELSLPELNDEFAQDIAFDTLEQLQESVRGNIQTEVEKEVNQKFESAVIEEIVGKSKIDELPPQLVQEETYKMLYELQQDTGQQGVDWKDYLSHIDKTEEELLEGFKEGAEKRLTAAIVLRELAVVEDIKVTKEEIEEEIAAMTKQYESIPDIVKQIDTPDQRARLENMKIHEKLFEALAGYAGVEKKDAKKDK